MNKRIEVKIILNDILNCQCTKSDIQENINCLDRYIRNKPRSSDFISMTNIKNLLYHIKDQLSE